MLRKKKEHQRRDDAGELERRVWGIEVGLDLLVNGDLGSGTTAFGGVIHDILGG